MAPDRQPRSDRSWSDEAPDRVALPPAGTGERRRRRIGERAPSSRRKRGGDDRAATSGGPEVAAPAPVRRRSRRRPSEPAVPAASPSPDAADEGRRTSTVLVLAVVGAVLAVLAGLLAFGWERLDDLTEEVDPAVGTDADAPAASDGPAPVLVVHQADDGGLVSVAVISPGDTGGGDVVLIPAGAMVEVPSYGLDPLRQALALGGLSLLQQSVENLLGVAFGGVAVLDPATVEALVRPAGVLTVELPERVEEVSASGRVAVLFDAGPNAVPPDRAAELLDAPAPSGLDQLVRHQALWSAWLGALRAAPDAIGAVDRAAALVDILPGLASGDVDFHVVPVEAVASGLESDGDLWRVRGEALRQLVAEVLPDAPRAAAGGRIRVQLLNGTGEPGLAQRVQPLLVPAGAEVTLAGNASRFDHEVTQVVYYDDADLGSARAVQAALGVGEVVRSRTRLDVVDVTVVVGADLVGTLEDSGSGDGGSTTEE